MSDDVTVVVATRDRPEMVREAIAAIAAQDFPGVIATIVVFDQCEPDLGLIDDRPDRPVTVIRNAHSAGLAGARNSGIEAATSEFVAFCDDDDYWLAGKVSRQIEALQRAPDAGLCTTGIVVKYDDESHPRVWSRFEMPFAELLRDRHTELHPSTFLMRRSIVTESIGLVDENVPGGFGEDYDFLLRAARHHPVVNVPLPFAVVRWGEQSYFFRRWQTMAAGLTWLLERYPEFETSRPGSARIRGQIAFAHAAMGHRRDARTWAFGALRRNPREARAVLALAVQLRVVSTDRVMETLHRRGRGI